MAQQRTTRILFILLCCIGGIMAVIFGIHYCESTVTVFDQPGELSGKTETIEVIYVNWACDCPDFVETKYALGEIDEKDCIFIEPASDSIKVDGHFYQHSFSRSLKLTGQYYCEKGIPNSYEQKTPEKPEKAKVFRYTHIEIISKK
jgi:hypothetical protein